MPRITDYASLQTTIQEWMNRPDADDAVEQFIQSAESNFRRDKRVQKLTNAALTLTSGVLALPSDFVSVESLSIEGPTNYRELENASPGELASVKREFVAGGTPRLFALVAPQQIEVGPVPAAPTAARLSYWATVPFLSDAEPTNWLLDSDPDIYLYGALVEAAPYMLEDSRLGVWGSMLEDRLEKLRQNTWRNQYGGALRTRPARAIP